MREYDTGRISAPRPIWCVAGSTEAAGFADSILRSSESKRMSLHARVTALPDAAARIALQGAPIALAHHQCGHSAFVADPHDIDRGISLSALVRSA